MFGSGDSAFIRYSVSGERGFMPQNLPGYGFNHDNLGQNGSIVWTHVFSPNVVNTVSASASRLAMFHYTENNGVNDIVGDLGITGAISEARAPGALPISTCRATRRWAMRGSPRQCTCGTRSWRAATR